MTRPTLLLLPGLLCDAATWSAQCSDLADLARCHVPAYGLLNTIEAMAELRASVG